MGHALNGTIQDILIRYNRMKGFKTLWMPGIDHAGIATQNKVEKALKEKGVNRKELGREKFEKEVWAWKKKYGNIIIGQLKKMGLSCDWPRLRFTMDKPYRNAVKKAFIHYYNKGLIYRGPRIVNWCPRCETAISDIEINYKDTKGMLYYIKYPLSQIPIRQLAEQSQTHIVVATTRPETMLGDTAVAVNPKDERYGNLIGKTITLPIMNREIPIIADRLVDAEFGTGAVKITPAHDMLDNRIAKIHKLPIINIIGEDNRMTTMAGKFSGLAVSEAREAVINELKNKNILEKEENYDHPIALCERCGAAIEPLISTQWFLKMKRLAKPAVKSVKQNKIKFIPQRYAKTCLEWMRNIEDWCISRQLWWGHRLPVYFCGNKREEISNKLINYVVAEKKPKKCPLCGKCEMKQSEDVLDTWFSSALWPFAILKWPQPTKELKQFYPNNFLSTAQEILYLWVARMIFSGLEFIGEVPFRQVYIHPTILNIKGQRMSKSLGTGVDPLELTEKYGADALRFGIILQTSRDQQAVKFSEEYVNAGRKFANKLWNINNFIKILSRDSRRCHLRRGGDVISARISVKTLPDKWILSRIYSVTMEVEKNIQNYKFDKALNAIYKFVWRELADWYIEINKISGFQNTKLLQNVFQKTLILLHPFMPFITENLWRNVYKNRDTLIVQSWPKENKKYINKKIKGDFAAIQKSVFKIRKARIGKKIPPPETIKIKLPKNNKILWKYKDIIAKLGKAEIS